MLWTAGLILVWLGSPMALLKKGDLSQANPWVYFWILAISNSLLAYSNFSYIVKSWIFFFGVPAPFFLSIGTRMKKSPGSWDREQFPLVVKPASLTVMCGLAVFLRFFKLTGFHLCPTGDEGLHGFLAIPLSEKWNWQFYDTVGEHPPLLIWVLSFFFRFFDSPFFNLWFFPALISALNRSHGIFGRPPVFLKIHGQLVWDSIGLQFLADGFLGDFVIKASSSLFGNTQVFGCWGGF